MSTKELNEKMEKAWQDWQVNGPVYYSNLLPVVCSNPFKGISAESDVDAMAKVTSEENSENTF